MVMPNEQHTSHPEHAVEIRLLDYARVVWKYRIMVVAIVAAASVAAVVASLLMTKMYRADTLIIPVTAKGGGGLSSIASQYGGLASLAGISLPGGAAEADKIMAILKSRTLAENVIAAENLIPLLFAQQWDEKNQRWKFDDPKKRPSMEKAVKKMRGLVMTTDDKKNKTIKIAAEWDDPQVAARVANAYVSELQKFIRANAFTTAKRNRLFIEGQLADNKEALLEAGKEINEYYTRGRVSSSEAQVDVPIVKKDQLASDRVLMAENGSGAPASDAGPPVGELSALMIQKEELEKKIASARVVQDVPQQVYLSYLMLRRELLGKVNALLTTQYEMAKIEESKEDLAFQVIDSAVPPQERFKPRRTQICMVTFTAALLAAILLALAREHVRRMNLRWPF